MVDPRSRFSRRLIHAVAEMWIIFIATSQIAAVDRPVDADVDAQHTSDTAVGSVDHDAPDDSADLHHPWEQIERLVDESKTFGKAKLSVEYQFDTRGFNTLNFTGSAPLPAGFNIWGFVDFESPDGGPDDSRYDHSEYFFEIDVKRKVWEDLGAIVEVNDMHGTDNALSRLGVFWAPQGQFLEDHELFFFVKIFPLESDGRGYQISFSWDKKFPDVLDGRFSVGGFFDANFDNGPGKDKVEIVSDTQFRYRLIDGLHLLAEFRFNEFLGSNKDVGVGFGFQYHF